MDSRSQANGCCNHAASNHTHGKAFFLINKTASNHNIIALVHFLPHRLYILRPVLSVSVKLNGILISLQAGIFHPSLKASSQPQIHRQIQKMISSASAYFRSLVLGTIIDYQIIQLRIVRDQLVHHPLNIFRFIISWNHYKHPVHSFLPFPCARITSQISSATSTGISAYRGSVST